MDEKTFHIIHEDTIKALLEYRLYDALCALSGLVDSVNNWNLQTEYDGIKSEYELLLTYMGQGVADPERFKLHKQFIRRTYELLDRVERQFFKASSSAYYYTQVRVYDRGEAPTFEQIVMRLEANRQSIEWIENSKDSTNNYQDELISLYKEHTGLYQEMFNCVWTIPHWTNSHTETAHNLIASSLISENDKTLFISSLTLSALSLFDEQKMMLLIEYCQHNEVVIKERALVGLVLAFMYHYKRMLYYPEVISRICLLQDIPNFNSLLCSLQIQLLMSQETCNIERKIRDNIIPTILKNPNFKPTKFGLEEIDEMFKKNDLNPDWLKNEDVKRVEKTINQLAEMHAEGADVYMSTFSGLKYYPFFTHAANWFYPFDPEHPDIKTVITQIEGGTTTFINAFLQTEALCDSDKYSFVYMASSIPLMQRNMLQEQIMSQEQLNDKQAFDRIAKNSRNPYNIRRLYLQDLYRFFKLFKNRKDHIDPFSLNPLLTEYSPFDRLLNSSDQLEQLASFAFKQDAFDTACKLFELMAAQNSLTVEGFQKMGYCRQKQNRISEAIECYEKANLMRPDSRWTINHLAQCYRQLGDYEKALTYYELLETMEPDNLQTLFRCGECLIQLRRYEESFVYFFKVEYLEKRPEKAMRAIAWCSFLTDKLEQAEKYYIKLLKSMPKAEDYLNAGHTAWAKGNIKQAIEHYKKFKKNNKEERFSLLQFFIEDKQELSYYKITEEDIHLMVDLLEQS